MNRLLAPFIIMMAMNAAAQDFSFNPKGRTREITVVVENIVTDLVIEGTKSGEIRIIADGYEGIPEKAAGLRPLSALGPDNTGIGLNVSQEGAVVTISGVRRNRGDTDYRIILPADVRLKLGADGFRSDDLVVRGMSGEVNVSYKTGDLIFDDVTGPIVASTISGDIKLVLRELDQSSPSSINSVSGDIDVSIPTGSKASLNISSVSGEIYTDLDLQIEEIRRYGMNAQAILNGGGVQVNIQSVSGDVFLRKGGR